MDPKVPHIVYSCTSKKKIDGELFIKQHVLDYIISGTSEVYFDGKYHLFKAGDFRFAQRNRLSKFVKIPPAGGEYRSISICIDQNTLFEMKEHHHGRSTESDKNDNVILLKPNKVFNNYMDSLLPYLNNQDAISAELIRIKVKEAVLVFLQVNQQLKNILFDFGEPGKIDLEAYMNEHYQFNGDIEEFAYLTGRSKSTFKRDFKAIFEVTPNRWLLQKRLAEAYYLIKEKSWKSTEVYLEVGFKDYSHFSVAFKKSFGSAPSVI